MIYRNLTAQKAEEINAWTQLWLIESAEAGYVTPPYHADDETLERALALFDAGLEPIEAATVMFARLH